MISREFLRFLAVGLANTAFSYGLYLLLDLWLPYKIAYSIAYVCGIIFSYFLNARWVFKTVVSLKTFFAFPLVYVVQYVLSMLGLHLLVELFSVPEKLAPIIVIVLTIPVTFLVSRVIVKKPSEQASSRP